MDYTVFETDLIKSGIEFTINEQLSRLTTIRLGGRSDYYAKPKTVIELVKCLEIAKRHGVRYFIIGEGSNLLVSDKGFRGIAISTVGVDEVYIERSFGQSVFVRAFCGLTLQKLNAFCMRNCLTGLEFLCGIPATVGGAITMNAGFSDKSISEKTTSVLCLNGNSFFNKNREECGFEYRKSVFQASGFMVISALFHTKIASLSQIRDSIALYRKLRKTPPGKSMGSIFKNGIVPSGKVIESVGLKGYRIGGAFVSPIHANVIINDGTASASDVYSLIQTVKETVKNKLGLQLEEEIKYIGEF